MGFSTDEGITLYSRSFSKTWLFVECLDRHRLLLLNTSCLKERFKVFSTSQTLIRSFIASLLRSFFLQFWPRQTLLHGWAREARRSFKRRLTRRPPATTMKTSASGWLAGSPMSTACNLLLKVTTSTFATPAFPRFREILKADSHMLRLTCATAAEVWSAEK